MKHPRIIATTLAPLILGCCALGQAVADREVPDQPSNQEIAAAHSQYIQTADLSGGPSGGEAYPQTRRPATRPPLPPRTGYPRAGHPAMFSGGNPKGAAIGALVGFGLGAALGAKVNTDNHGGAGVKAAVLFGSFGALLGGVAGSSFQPLHHGFAHRRPWPADDEQGSRPKGSHTEQTVAARPAAPPGTNGARDSALPASGTP